MNACSERVKALRDRFLSRLGRLVATGGFAVGVLLLLFFVARYLLAGGFGWYEDDLTIMPHAVELSPRELIDFVGSYIINMYGHARPLSDSLIYILSNIGWRIAGLRGPYLLGFLVEAGNIALFYTLVRRVWGPRIALLAGLGYVLFSADTTQAFLTHSLGAQPSITLLLLAFHAYLSGRFVLSYCLAFLILFSYETPFPVFLAAPLMGSVDRQARLRRVGVHAGVMVGMLVVAFGLKAWAGEERVAGQSILQLVASSAEHMVIGPLVGLGTYLYRPLQAATSGEPAVYLVICMAVPIFVLLLRAAPSMGLDRKGDGSTGRYLALLGVAAVMLVLGYALALTVRPYALSGRDTRVHMAAVPGAALVVGATIRWLLDYSRDRRWILVPLVTLSTWLAFLLGFGLVVQEDYVRSWKLQQGFWREVVALAPDARDGTAILVDPAALEDTRHIGANYWNLPRIFEQLFEFPADWSLPPRVYRLSEDWERSLVSSDGSFVLDAQSAFIPPSNYTKADPTDVVVLGPSESGMVRKDAITIGGRVYSLQPRLAPQAVEYPRSLLYRLLIDGADR